MKCLILLIVTCMLSPLVLADPGAVYQWSVPVQPQAPIPTTTPSTAPAVPQTPARAYLWIAPSCERVRGIIFGHHNMQELPIFESPRFRKTMEELGLAIVWVAPKFDQNFRFDLDASVRFESMLADLARESGYDELTRVPLIPCGHSAAASMPWYMAGWNPDRIAAGISFSGQWPYVNDEKNAPQAIGKTFDSVPGIVTIGEYEWADARMKDGEKIRVEHPMMPLSAVGCPADGHFGCTDEKIDLLAMYIRKVVEYRLPPSSDATKLRAIDPTQTGWLVQRYRLGKDPEFPAAPVAQYKGDPKQAYWFFDEQLARAVEAFQARQRGKPALLGYVQDGAVLPQKNGQHAQVLIPFKPQNDGLTFKLAPSFIDIVPEGRPEKWAGKKAGEKIDVPQTSVPISIDRICGPISKLSSDTWTVDFDRTCFLGDSRGNEAWLLATWPGDESIGYKRMVQQSRLGIPGRNGKGTKQSIDFAEIKDVPADAREIKLSARSSAELPVRFFVRSGPVQVDGDTLKVLPIPVKARNKPIRVIVVAWQFGRSVEPLVQSAEPVTREFFIGK